MAGKVFVTGSSGMLGVECLRHLDATGWTATGVSRRPLPGGSAGLTQITVGSVLAADWLEDASAPVLHCAGLSDARAPFDGVTDLLSREVAPQVAFVEAMLARGWRGHLVYLSSAAVYGNPESLPVAEDHPLRPLGFYALQKVEVEQALGFLARHHGFGLSVLRVANPYGGARPLAERGVLRLLFDAARTGAPFTVNGSGEGLRDYLHMTDFVAAVARVLAAPPPPQDPVRVLNLGSGTGTSLNRLIGLVEAATGRRLDLRSVPSALEVASNVLDVCRAERVLGWRAVCGIEDGVRRIAAARAAEEGAKC